MLSRIGPLSNLSLTPIEAKTCEGRHKLRWTLHTHSFLPSSIREKIFKFPLSQKKTIQFSATIQKGSLKSDQSPLKKLFK